MSNESDIVERLPLPAPAYTRIDKNSMWPNMWREDQMLAYGRACADAEIERCAALCDDLLDGCDYTGADLCATAIRALKGAAPQQPEPVEVPR